MTVKPVKNAAVCTFGSQQSKQSVDWFWAAVVEFGTWLFFVSWYLIDFSLIICRYTGDQVPHHPCLTLIANSEQVLSTTIGRRLITMEKTRHIQVLTPWARLTAIAAAWEMPLGRFWFCFVEPWIILRNLCADIDWNDRFYCGEGDKLHWVISQYICYITIQYRTLFMKT